MEPARFSSQGAFQPSPPASQFRAFAQEQLYYILRFSATQWAKAAQAGRFLPAVNVLGFRA